MTPITLGHLEAHEKLTARVHFQPDGADGYHDLGNVKEYTQAHEYSVVNRVIAEKGYRRTVDEQVDVVTAAWEFTLDEFDATLLQVLHQGSAGAGVTQDEVTTLTVNPLPISRLGVWFPIGKVGLTGLVVTNDDTPTDTLVLGVDYEVDMGAGMIRFLTRLGENAIMTLSAPEVAFETVTGLDAPTWRGEFILHEYNQHSTIPLRTTTFAGVIRATEFPTQSGEMGTWKVKVTATTKPVVQRRSVA